MPSIDLSPSRVLVLGGSGVLGGAIAEELTSRGASVMLAGRDADRLRTAASRLGPTVPSVLFDLREPHHADHVIDTAVATVMETNLVGPLRVMQRALAHMEGGFFVNLTGVVAERPMPGMAVYSAAKAGLSAASAALAKELRRNGIHVVDARPPHTETGLATRPVAGVAPAMPEGLSPQHVARVIVDGLASGARELPAEAFAA